MGISGLLPLVRDIERPAHVRELRGRTVAVDAYVWLHRGAYACAAELVATAASGAPGTPPVSPDRYCSFALSRIRLLRQHGVVPLLVFDGGRLPSKQHTEAARAAARRAAKDVAVAAVQSGDPAARELCSKAVDITPAMARALMDRLAHLGVDFLVAPYEADAQMAFLERVGLVDAVLSEDSDLLVYGTRLLLTKLQPDGSCIALSAQDLPRAKAPALGTGRAAAAQPLHDWASAAPNSSGDPHPCAPPWANTRQLKALTHLRHAALLSGCDYLPGLAGIGLRSAATLIRRYGSPARVVRHLMFEGKTCLPSPSDLDTSELCAAVGGGRSLHGADDAPPGRHQLSRVDAYLASFRRAELTFLHQRVWDPRDGGKLVCLAPLPAASPTEDPAVRAERARAEHTIGPWIEEGIARGIALGDLDPQTHEPLAAPVAFFRAAPRFSLDSGTTSRSSSSHPSFGSGSGSGSRPGTLSFYKPSAACYVSDPTPSRGQRTLGSFFTQRGEPARPHHASPAHTKTPTPLKSTATRPDGCTDTTPVPRASLRSRFFPKHKPAVETMQQQQQQQQQQQASPCLPDADTAHNMGYWGAGAWRTPQAQARTGSDRLCGETQVLADTQLFGLGPCLGMQHQQPGCGPAAAMLCVATQTQTNPIETCADVLPPAGADTTPWLDASVEAQAQAHEQEDGFVPAGASTRANASPCRKSRIRNRPRPRSASISSLISEPVSEEDVSRSSTPADPGAGAGASARARYGESAGAGAGANAGQRKRSVSLSSGGEPTPRSKRMREWPELLVPLVAPRDRNARCALELGAEDWDETLEEIEEFGPEDAAQQPVRSSSSHSVLAQRRSGSTPPRPWPSQAHAQTPTHTQNQCQSQSRRQSKEDEEGLISSPCSAAVRSSASPPVPSTSNTPRALSPAAARAVARRMLYPLPALPAPASPPPPVASAATLICALCSPSHSHSDSHSHSHSRSQSRPHPHTPSRSQRALAMHRPAVAASPRTEALFARRGLLLVSPGRHAHPHPLVCGRSVVPAVLDLSTSEGEDGTEPADAAGARVGARAEDEDEDEDEDEVQCEEFSPLAPWRQRMARRPSSAHVSRGKPVVHSEDEIELVSSEDVQAVRAARLGTGASGVAVSGRPGHVRTRAGTRALDGKDGDEDGDEGATRAASTGSLLARFGAGAAATRGSGSGGHVVERGGVRDHVLAAASDEDESESEPLCAGLTTARAVPGLALDLGRFRAPQCSVLACSHPRAPAPGP